jgi:hypothetical protein
VSSFTFFRIKNGTSIPSFEVAEFDKEAWAIDYGRSILTRNSRYDFCEIVEGERFVTRLARLGAGMFTQGGGVAASQHIERS